MLHVNQDEAQSRAGVCAFPSSLGLHPVFTLLTQMKSSQTLNSSALGWSCVNRVNRTRIHHPLSPSAVFHSYTGLHSAHPSVYAGHLQSISLCNEALHLCLHLSLPHFISGMFSSVAPVDLSPSLLVSTSLPLNLLSHMLTCPHRSCTVFILIILQPIS